MQGWALYKYGKVQEAIDMLVEVLKERENLDATYYRSAPYIKKPAGWKNPSRCSKRAVSNLPTNYDIFFNYIKTLIAARQYQEVIAVLAETNYPQMELDPEIWNKLGLAYARTDQPAKAVEAYEQALALDERYPELNYNLGDVYQALASKNETIVS